MFRIPPKDEDLVFLKQPLYYLLIASLMFAIGGFLWTIINSFRVPSCDAAEEPTQATLPPELKAQTVDDIPAGKFFYLGPDALVVGLDQKCWLQRNAVTYNTITPLAVQLKQDGYYVYVDGSVKWLSVDLEKYQAKETLIPVRSFILATKQLPATHPENSPKDQHESRDPAPKTAPAPKP
jgi:hypothetical protein